jgi:hypothetical protein
LQQVNPTCCPNEVHSRIFLLLGFSAELLGCCRIAEAGLPGAGLPASSAKLVKIMRYKQQQLGCCCQFICRFTSCPADLVQHQVYLLQNCSLAAA